VLEREQAQVLEPELELVQVQALALEGKLNLRVACQAMAQALVKLLELVQTLEQVEAQVLELE
jgi:hypothetical protein